MQNGQSPNAKFGQVLSDYLPKLIRLAENYISPKLSQKVDAEDVGLSVLRTVVRQLNEDRIVIEHSEHFWPLLVGITKNKVRKTARYWSAQKRSIVKEQALAEDGPDLEALAVFDPIILDDPPTEEDGEAFADVLKRLDELLDEKHRRVVTAKLGGKTHVEIAEMLGTSTKTVGRYLRRVEQVLLELSQENDD